MVNFVRILFYIWSVYRKFDFFNRNYWFFFRYDLDGVWWFKVFCLLVLKSGFKDFSLIDLYCNVGKFFNSKD